MASGAVFDAIKSYLGGDGVTAAAWATTPVRWENEPFETPTTGGDNPQSLPWVDVEMSGKFYGQETIGASLQADNRWDEEGELWLHVMVPINTGGSTARTYAKSLADLFRGRTLLGDSLEFRDSFIGRGRPGDEDGAWYQVSVYIEWRRFEA